MSTTIKSASLVLVNKQNGVVVIPKSTPLTRLNYFDGKFLRASDLKAEQDYLRQLVRHSNQAGGPGVAHGFDLTLGRGDTLDIGPGLAIDPGGRVLLMPQEVSLGIEDLIEKSRDLQRIFGKQNVTRAGGFETCELTAEAAPVNTTEPNNLFLIVISSAEALCGEEDVFGKLCEEACATSTDRPYVVEGLIVRAIPLVLRTPLPHSKAVSLTQAHLRSRVASAYFEDERRTIASLISKFGLQQETWCLGADAAGGSGVPIGVIARAGAGTVFLDPWIARRERIDSPARRYWQWRMMMRPWDVFLAQVLQFQCQLHDLSQKTRSPGGDDDPCGGARVAIDEAATTIAELRQFYQSTTERFTKMNVNLDEAMTFKGGVTRLSALNEKLVSVKAGLATAPQDRWLLRGGIIELPSAGYLPVVPGAAATINQQVRRMMGEGVDLRFCIVRPDYVAHALEEAQHMERISLLEGLDDPKNRPAVDILVPNGEIIEQKRLSPGSGFEATVDLNSLLLTGRSTSLAAAPQSRSLTFRGAARTETLAAGGGAAYLSAEFEANQIGAFESFEAGGKDTAVLSSGEGSVLTRSGGSSFAAVSSSSRRAGIWLSLRCERNIFELKKGDDTNFNARAVVVSTTSAKIPMLDVELNGVFEVVQQAVTKGTRRALRGRIDNARLSFLGQMFSNAGPRKTILVDLAASIAASGNAIEINLGQGQSQFELSANWDNQPLAIKAAIKTVGKDANGQAQETTLAQTNLKENPDVLSAKNASHVNALDALELIASVLNDAAFADAKTRLLFPPPPKPTDELLVRGNMDWVLFHSRRAKQCSEEKIVPPPPSSRHYQVFEVLAKSATESDELLKSIVAGTIPSNRLLPVAVVEFGGGVATLISDSDDLLDDWKRVKPGNVIMFGGIVSRDSAADDSEALSASRLKRVEAAVSSVSPLSPQSVQRILTKVPDSTPAAGVDGAIILLTLSQVEKTCHTVYRVRPNPDFFNEVIKLVTDGKIDSDIFRRMTDELGAVTFKLDSVDVLDNSTQPVFNAWKALNAGEPARAAVVIKKGNPEDNSQDLQEKRALVIQKALGGKLTVATGGEGDFSSGCPVITLVADQQAQQTRTGRLLIQIDSNTAGQRFFASTQPLVLAVKFNADGTLASPLATNVIAGIRAIAPNLIPLVELAPDQAPADPRANVRLKSIFEALTAAGLLRPNPKAQLAVMKPTEQPHLDIGGGVKADDLIFLLRN